MAGILPMLHATIRLPEEFNVEADFSEKEKWRKGQSYIKCDLCKVLVGKTFDAIGEQFIEDDVYDHIDKICDAEEIYNSYEMIGESPGSWQLVKERAATGEQARSAHVKRWQTHAMKELCDNIIKPNDDEFKDSFLKARKRAKKQKLPGMGEREPVVRSACEQVKLCKKKGSAGEL
mmetsp:Transcript_82579/g.143292  ORF Transcript_82579/g.143292 Transcript_82579/m.143292 type:complete len:176 (+) Transcript_82579:3-530(+)